MQKGRQLLDFALYSGLWIATGALAFSLQTRLLLERPIELTPWAGVVFFGTWAVYALHRTRGLDQIDLHAHNGRFNALMRLRGPIVWTGWAAALCALLFALRLPLNILWTLLLPGLLSVGYVFPFLRGGQRLSDVPFLKIFLVAFVWAWATVVAPAIEADIALDATVWVMLAGRSLFVFAITLPFEWRDRTTDKHLGIDTLSQRLGTRTMLLLACTLLLLAFCISTYLFGWHGGIAVAYAITALLVLLSVQNRHDYWFVGLLDGTMLLQFALLWWL